MGKSFRLNLAVLLACAALANLGFSESEGSAGLGEEAIADAKALKGISYRNTARDPEISKVTFSPEGDVELDANTESLVGKYQRAGNSYRVTVSKNGETQAFNLKETGNELVDERDQRYLKDDPGLSDHQNACRCAVTRLKTEIENLPKDGDQLVCYSVDGGKLSKQTPHGQHAQLSPSACFVIPFKNRSQAENYFVFDWQYLGEKFANVTRFSLSKELPELKNVLVIMPDDPLESGIYSISSEGKPELCSFCVEISGEAEFWPRVIAKHPNSWQAHNHLGAVYYVRQDYDSALEHFKRGVEISPGNCEVQNNLGLALQAKGNLEEALVHFAEAVKIHGKDASIRMNFANALSQSKRYGEAIVQYREAVKYPSENKAGVYFNLGNTLLLNGQLAVAREAYQESLRIDPSFQDAKRNLEFADQKLKEQETK